MICLGVFWKIKSILNLCIYNTRNNLLIEIGSAKLSVFQNSFLSESVFLNSISMYNQISNELKMHQEGSLAYLNFCVTLPGILTSFTICPLFSSCIIAAKMFSSALCYNYF